MKVISSKPDTLAEYLDKIWQHRSLIVVFAWRDLRIKYAQTWLGLSWTILQPLSAVVIFTLFFSVILQLHSSYPYILFVLSGILFWGFFNFIFSHGSSSLLSNQDLIRKMNFPKIALPFSKVLMALAEFGITFLLLIAVILFFQIPFRLTMLLMPFVLIPVLLFSLGLALILSSLTIKNRDLFHIIPFLVNFGIWFTPVFYPVSLIPTEYSAYSNILFINPVAAGIQLFRWSFFGEQLNFYVAIGIGISFITFLIGFYFFKNSEDKIIDLL